MLIRDTVYSNGTSITEYEGDIYISGSKGPNASQCDPCYWKNGIITYLTSGSATISLSNSICIFTDDVYNCGELEGEAFYSKNNQVNQLYRPPGSTAANALDISVTRSIQ